MKYLLVKIKVPSFAKLRTWLNTHKPSVQTRKKILFGFLRGGSKLLGWAAIRFTGLLFWNLKERTFISRPALHWTFSPEYINANYWKGVNKTLKDNLTPSEALDRLKAEQEIQNSFVRYING